MTSLTTFYLSTIIGKEAYGADGDAIGIIKDLLVNSVQENVAMVITKDSERIIIIG